MESETRGRIQEEVDTLKTLRDELRVRIHLGAADARDAWEKAEKSWEHLEGRMKVIGDVTQDSASEVAEAISLLTEEIRRGYRQIRDVL